MNSHVNRDIIESNWSAPEIRESHENTFHSQVQGEGVQKGKPDPVCKNQGPPHEKKKRPHLRKKKGEDPPTPNQIRPNFYLRLGKTCIKSKSKNIFS